MIDKSWYDKIAASAAEAERVLADAAGEENENNNAEEAADEAQEAEDVDEAASREGTVDEARLQEDIMIAQEVAATDLPTDIKVEIMEEQGVDPSIINEVIDADTTDAVAAYYGVDPYWLHDKRAAYGNAVFNTIADVQDSAPLAVQLGLLGGALGAAPGIIGAASNRDRLKAFGYNPWVEGGKAALAGGASGAILGGTLGWIGDRFLNKLGSAGDLPLYLEDKTAGLEDVMAEAGEWADDKTRALKQWLASERNQQALMGGAAGGLLGAGLGYAAGGGTGALLGGLGGAGLGAYGMYNYNNIDPRLLNTGTGAVLGGLAGAGLGYMTGNGMNAALGGLAGAGLGAAGAYMYPEVEPKLGSYTGSAWLDDKLAAGAGSAVRAAGRLVSKAWNKLPGKAKAAIGATTAGAALGGTARAAYKAGEKKQEITDRWNAGGNLLSKKD